LDVQKEKIIGLGPPGDHAVHIPYKVCKVAITAHILTEISRSAFLK